MKKANPIVIAGAVLALVGVVALTGLASRGGSASRVKTTRVLVATAPVAAGTAAAAAPLALRALPATAVPDGALTDLTALTGQVALHSLARGEVVVPASFGQQGVAQSGGVLLPKGQEGLGVELGFAPGGLRYVVPGNTINVWGSAKGIGTRLLLSGVQVIATTPGSGTGAPTQVTAGPGNLDFLLAVSRSQAMQVIDAQANGAALYFTLAGTGPKA